jgi:hypothetical protein
VIFHVGLLWSDTTCLGLNLRDAQTGRLAHHLNALIEVVRALGGPFLSARAVRPANRSASVSEFSVSYWKSLERRVSCAGLSVWWLQLR